MVYLVVCFPRSGSSMFMELCHAGGMDIVYNPARGKALFAAALPHCPTCHRPTPEGRPDPFLFNPGDVYESTAAERAHPSWPRGHAGKVIKVVVQWLGSLAVADYTVAFLRRDTEAIRLSCERAFETRFDPDPRKARAFIDRQIDEAYRTLENRADVRAVTTVRYEDLLSDPAPALARLGWPLRAAAAARVIDPDWRTHAAAYSAP